MKTKELSQSVRTRRWSGMKERYPWTTKFILFMLAVGLVSGVTLTIRAYAVQAYYIKSSSMEPTLRASDRIFVNKLSYSAHEINRGDVVIISRSKAFNQDSGFETDDLVKRVIGLSGETVQIEACQVYINGVLLNEPYIRELERSSRAYSANCLGRNLNNRTYEVPENQIFVLGDNRLNSVDSRIFGSIPENSITGRAFLKIWPLWNFTIL